MRVYQANTTRHIARVRFSPNGDRLTAIVRRTVSLVHFDLLTGQLHEWASHLRSTLVALDFSADTQLIGLGTYGGTGATYRSPENREVKQFDVGRSPEADDIRSVSAVRFSPAREPKNWLAMAAAQFCLWNPYSQEHIYAEADGDYRGVSFGPDGSFVACIEAHAHCLTAWNVKPFRVRFRTELAGIGEFANGAVAVLPDGDRIVYAAGDQLRCVAMSGGPGWVATLKRPAVDLALHPNGQTLLLADGSKRVTQFYTDSGRPVNSFDWGVGKVSCVDMSRDGTLAAAGGEKGQVVAWDAE
jgi:WD40 repeat protein